MRIDTHQQAYALQELQGPSCPICGQRLDQCSCQSAQAVGGRNDGQTTAPVLQQQAEAMAQAGALGFVSEMASRLYLPPTETSAVETNSVSPRRAAEIYENRAHEHSSMPARVSRLA